MKQDQAKLVAAALKSDSAYATADLDSLHAIAGMFVAVFEGEFGDAGFVEVAEAFRDHAVVLFLCRAPERQIETEVARQLGPKIVGDFIAAHSAPVALREGVLYVRVLQPALHYELEQISKSEILRKLKLRFGAKNHPRDPFPRRLINQASEDTRRRVKHHWRNVCGGLGT